MNCDDCNSLLMEYIEDLLDAPGKEKIERHLKECPQCRKALDDSLAIRDRLINHRRNANPADFEDRVMDRIFSEQRARLKAADASLTAASSAGFLHQLRSLVMKNIMIKVAAAAAVVFAVIVGLNYIQSGITFAQVAEPVLKARTIAYDCVFGDPAKGISIHDIVIGQRIRRSFSNMPLTLIIDTENKRMLALDPVQKGGAFLDISGMVADNNRDFLYFVRNTLNEAMNDQASAVEELGRERINGLEAIGFQLRSENEREKIVIWADASTALPIQINLQLDESTYMLRNIQFEVPTDEALVSMELPDGYARQKQEVDMTKFSEVDFLTVLRIYAKYMRDESFPDKLAFEDLLKLVPDLGKVVPRMDLKPEEMREIGNVFARGMMFLQNLTATGAESHYAGRGIRFGDGTKEVFRYRMPDSPSWRVIYGDLQVKEIAAHASAR